VVAPGGSIASGKRILSTSLPVDTTLSVEYYALGSGTSQAAASVTATCALALQVALQVNQKNKNLSFDQVLSVLQTTATKLIDPSTGKQYPPERQGAGLIDADKVDDAVKKLK
jgi:hypothetical protein